MRRIFIYLFATLTFVGCTTMDPSFDPEGPGPKPVRPIKPRPIVPDGTILRPRLGIWDLIALPDSFDWSHTHRVQLSTKRGEVLYDGECCSVNDTIDVVLDNSEELYIFVDGEYMGTYLCE